MSARVKTLPLVGSKDGAGVTPRVLVLADDPATLRHAQRALLDYASAEQRAGRSVPFGDVRVGLSSDLNRPSPTPLDVPSTGAQGGARELLNLDDVAVVLNVNRRTVERRVRSGALPSVREGRCRRVHRRALADYVEQLSHH